MSSATFRVLGPPRRPDRARTTGDPGGRLVARDELTAFDAINLIDVEYAPLRTFSRPEESLEHDTPRIHAYGDGGNIHKVVSLGFGDVEKAFAGADLVF